MMNPKSILKVFHQPLHAQNEIEINKTFAKMAENPASDEYNLLQQVRQDFPDYILRIKTIKKNTHKESYKGLTYAYMRDYIRTHEPDETREEVLAEFNEKILISRCHSQAYRYPVIKQWFLDKYKEIVTHGISDEEKPAA